MTPAVITAVILTTLAAAGTYLGAGLHYPGLPLTGWLDRLPAPRLPRRKDRHTDPGPSRPPSGAVPHQTPPRAHSISFSAEGLDGTERIACTCGYLAAGETAWAVHIAQAEIKPGRQGDTRPRREADKPERVTPDTALPPLHETGARRTIAGRVLARLIPARGCHAAGPDPLGLRRGLDGLLHDPDTGAFDVPRGYGVIPSGTHYEAAARAVGSAWGWP